jgi:two-component system cell cycle response regulator
MTFTKSITGGIEMSDEKKAKVLVVDDEEMIINFFLAALGEEGYQLEVAHNGREAIDKAKAFLPDVILLDVVMPELNGYQVAEYLKRDPGTSGTPIILVTGMGSIEDKVKGLESGADDFLTKPFNLQELLARVHSLIKLKQAQDQLKALGKQGVSHPQIRALKSHKHLVLVVEDDRRITDICRTLLNTGGYETEVAHDAGQALEYIAETVPDLILLDLMLPDMGGLELLKEIRGMPALSEVPVIIITALSDLKTKIKGLYLGADDYLVKPLNSLELLARVRANIRKYVAHQELKYTLDDTFLQSITDPLTGLYNRQYLTTVMEREFALFKRHGRPFTVMLLDVDGFKLINDTKGHDGGDKVLTEIGQILKGELRASDLAVRYGGDEYLLIFSEAGVDQAMPIAQRIRQKIAEKEFFEGARMPVTCSIGLAEASSQDLKTDDVIKRSDVAMYQAKNGGKNKTVAFN